MFTVQQMSDDRWVGERYIEYEVNKKQAGLDSAGPGPHQLHLNRLIGEGEGHLL